MNRNSFTKPNDNIILYSYNLDLTEEAMYKIKDVGIDKIMTWFPWDLLEPRQGEYNWQPIDNFIARLEKTGMETILRFPYSTPFWMPDEWYFKFQDGHTNKSADLGEYHRYLSYWNKDAQEYQADYISKILTRYESSPNFMGADFSGTWGEHMYPRTGNGLACYDDGAIADYREYMQNKYSSLIKYNMRNHTNAKSWEEIIPGDITGDIFSFIDTIDWYNENWYKHVREIQPLYLSHCKSPKKEIWLNTIPEHGFRNDWIQDGIWNCSEYVSKIRDEMNEIDVDTNCVWTFVWPTDAKTVGHFIWILRHYNFNVWVGAQGYRNIVENSIKSIMAGMRGVIVGAMEKPMSEELTSEDALDQLKIAKNLWNSRNKLLKEN